MSGLCKPLQKASCAQSSFPEIHSCICTPPATTQSLSAQVKLRGVRIELTEVEHHLSSFPGVKQALAVVHLDSIHQQHLVGYLSPDNIDIEQLRQHVAKFLPKQMIPESFVLLEQFPKMPNGKADRDSLPEPQYSDMAKADYIAPSDEMQEAVRTLSFEPTCDMMTELPNCFTFLWFVVGTAGCEWSSSAVTCSAASPWAQAPLHPPASTLGCVL